MCFVFVKLCESVVFVAGGVVLLQAFVRELHHEAQGPVKAVPLRR